MTKDDAYQPISNTSGDVDPGVRAEYENVILTYVTVAQRVRLCARSLMEGGQEDKAVALIGEAAGDGITGCTAEDARVWFERLTGGDKYELADKLAVAALRGGVHGITVADVRHWAQVFFEGNQAAHVGAVVVAAARGRQAQGFTDSVMLSYIEELFRANYRTKAVELAVFALNDGYLCRGMTEEQVRSWMEFLATKKDDVNYYRLGVAVLGRRGQFPGIRDEEIVGWIEHCRDVETVVSGVWVHSAADCAGFLEVAAYAQGVRGVTLQDINRTLDSVFIEDMHITNKANKLLIGPLIEYAMRRLKEKDVDVDELPVTRLVSHGEDMKVTLALKAIEHGLRGVDLAKVREWADVCIREGHPEQAAQILARAIEQGMPGIESAVDIENCRYEGTEFHGDSFSLITCSAIRTLNLPVDIVGITKIRIANCLTPQNRSYPGAGDGVFEYGMAVIESGREGFSGADLLSWVNKLLSETGREAEYIEDMARRGLPVPVPRRHFQAFTLFTRGLSGGLGEGVALADVLRIKKVYDDRGEYGEGMEILIAAREAGIGVPEELVQECRAGYETDVRTGEYSGEHAVSLAGMYRRHSRLERRYPELSADMDACLDRLLEQQDALGLTNNPSEASDTEAKIRKTLFGDRNM
jgi:hypothetical protein